jgi:hypothetical protein
VEIVTAFGRRTPRDFLCPPPFYLRQIIKIFQRKVFFLLVYVAIHFFSQIFKGTVGYGFFSKVNEIKTIKKEQSPKLLMKFYKGVALSLPPPSLRKFINSSFHTPFHQISNFLHDITTFLQHF